MNIKTLSTLAIMTILGLSTAIAQDAKVPTGVDVPGCVFYTLQDGTVVQDCTATTDPKKLIDPQNVNSPVNNTGTGE